MKALSTLSFFITISCFITSKDAVNPGKNDQKLVLRGRVTFPGGSRLPIEKDAQLTVKLQDTSLMDAPAKLIAQTTSKLVRFPASFTIEYSPKDLKNGLTYTLQARIENKKKELLYINDVQVQVTPVGPSRTKSIDIPVIQVKSVKKVTTESKKSQWPELVGKKGEDAVKIIKKETGFTDVYIIKENDPITLDLRNNRVCVVVNKKGIVTSTPNVA